VARALTGGDPGRTSSKSLVPPPTVVQAAQEAISWLARAITELEESSEQATATLAEILARLLAIAMFASLGGSKPRPRDASSGSLKYS
jgi:hypothetical protein